MIDLADRAGAQLLDGQQHDLLDEVARRLFVSQVTEPVQAHARREAAIELRLRLFGQSGHLRRHSPRHIAIAGLHTLRHRAATVAAGCRRRQTPSLERRVIP